MQWRIRRCKLIFLKSSGVQKRKIARKFDRADDIGDTSHFQALTTALSGTVGTGNIAGVALAIHLGGPAALFWMLVTAMLGMTTKFVEVTLSHKYRVKTEDGTMAGGPMYYMDRRLNMKWLAVAFAIAARPAPYDWCTDAHRQRYGRNRPVADHRPAPASGSTARRKRY